MNLKGSGLFLGCGKDNSPNSGRAASTQGWASGMPSDFGSSTTGSNVYSVYADYIPVAIEGNTSVYSSSDTSANRTAVPYTMSEDGVINSISIYHNGGSGNMILAVYNDDDGQPYYRGAITESKAVNSNAFLADGRIDRIL